MVGPVPPASRVSFGEFELDRRTGELRRNSLRVSIAEQPLRLLEVLVEHPGVVVSREQLRERLWSADTFVDFEHGLNAAVKRLRDALGDSADAPRFIETVPKRGYRLIVPVESPSNGLVNGPQVIPWFRHPGALAAGIAAVGLAAATAVWWVGVGRHETEPGFDEPRRLTRLTFDPGLQIDPAFSPDGRFIAYASNASGNFDVWIQALDGGAATRLTDHPGHDIQPAWSPDGRTILFRSDRDGGGLFAVSPDGRHVERRTRFGFAPRWAPDGRSFAFGSSIFFSGTSYIASADGSTIAAVAHQNEALRLTQGMGWHPSGRLVWLRGSGANIGLVSRRSAAQPPDESVIVDDVRRRFEELSLGVVDNQRLAWSADGRALYFVGQTQITVVTADIWRVSVDPDTLRVTDGPVRVTTGSEAEFALAGAPSGRLAFSASTRTTRVRILDLDDQGHLARGDGRAVTADTVVPSEPALTSDGRRLIVRIDHPGGDRVPELREIALDEGSERVLRRIDPMREDIRYPRWSPDGTRVAYSYRQFDSKDRFASAVKVLDVRSLDESFVTSPWTDGTPALENPWGWSADGHSILVTSARYRPPHLGLARVPLTAAPRAEDAASVLVANSGLGVWQATESPNGRWVCYNQTPAHSGEYSTLYVLPAQGGEPRRLIDGTSWDDKPRWAVDGRRVYFLSMRDGTFNIWSVGFDPDRGAAIGPPVQETRFGGPAETIVDHVGSAELSVSASRMALVVQKLAGGIWIME